MANQFGSNAHSGLTVLVEGQREIAKKLKAAGEDLSDLKELNHEVGEVVIDHANPPRDTGALASSLRAGYGYSKAVVRAGYASRVPYAGRDHYGDPHTGLRAQPFLTDALRKAQGEVVDTYADGMDALIKKHNL